MTTCIVLAAGRGTRLGPETARTPKCLVNLGDGTTFLSRILDLMLQHGHADRVGIVTGFAAESVQDMVARHPHRDAIALRHNPAFAESGPIVSIHAAADLLHDDVLLLCNGDTRYDQRIPSRLARHEGPGFVLAVQPSAAPASDEVKVARTPDGQVVAVGKALAAHEADSVSTGMLRVVGPEAMAALRTEVERYAVGPDPSLRHRVWHDLLNALVGSGRTVRTIEADPHEWREVDTLDELDATRRAAREADPRRR